MTCVNSPPEPEPEPELEHKLSDRKANVPGAQAEGREAAPGQCPPCEALLWEQWDQGCETSMKT